MIVCGRSCGRRAIPAPFLKVDMEHYAVKDMTLDIYKRVLSEPEFKDWPDCGIVIQVYMPGRRAAHRRSDRLVTQARRSDHDPAW